jgi:glycosyltransferase involved in cell wall biosynthesis
MRLAIVTKMLSPYRNPVFDDLSGRPGVELFVLTFSEDQEHRGWDMDRLYAESSFPCDRLSEKQSPFRVWQSLRRFNPDAVILGGYDTAQYLEGLAYCKVHGKKAVLWSGTTARSVRRRGSASAARKAFICSVDAYVAYGSLARDFLIASGAAPERIATGYNTVDISLFAALAESFRNTSQYAELRSRVDPVSLLFVGRLIEGKGFPCLLSALERLDHADFTLMVLGDGPLRGEFEQRASRMTVKVLFEGFRGIRELPLYYAACDLLVFPTLGDVWGLVVNEAMACAKPVVSSTEAGASYDLVQNGRNGWVVNPRDTSELARRLGELIANQRLREQMGAESARMIQQFTPHALADALLSASSPA